MGAAPGHHCRDHREPGEWESSCASSTTLGPRWVRVTTVEHGHERSPTVAHGLEEPQVAGPSAQAAGRTQTRDSDCGPEGHRASRHTLTCRPPGSVGGRGSRPGGARRPRARAAAQGAVVPSHRSWPSVAVCLTESALWALLLPSLSHCLTEKWPATRVVSLKLAPCCSSACSWHNRSRPVSGHKSTAAGARAAVARSSSSRRENGQARRDRHRVQALGLPYPHHGAVGEAHVQDRRYHPKPLWASRAAQCRRAAGSRRACQRARAAGETRA
jgi:hypothetical protein